LVLVSAATLTRSEPDRTGRPQLNAHLRRTGARPVSTIRGWLSDLVNHDFRNAFCASFRQKRSLISLHYFLLMPQTSQLKPPVSDLRLSRRVRCLTKKAPEHVGGFQCSLYQAARRANLDTR
jgi:hypothetical protein